MDLKPLPAEMRPLFAQATAPQRFAAVLWAEARSEPIEGIAAVANVIINLAAGKDVAAVLLTFPCWTPAGGETTHTRLLELMRQFASKEPITDPAVRECIGVAHLALGGYLRDNTRHSTKYHRAALTPRPEWAQDHVPIVQRGHIVAYNTVTEAR